MEKETKHYVEYLNCYSKWLKKITIWIDNFLINREYIDFFMQMYMQWSKDDGSTSSFQKSIIPHLPRFEKLALYLYIEIETMTQCFVCCNFQKTILIRSAEGKYLKSCILHLLSIHNGLRKLSKTNLYDLHL